MNHTKVISLRYHTKKGYNNFNDFTDLISIIGGGDRGGHVPPPPPLLLVKKRLRYFNREVSHSHKTVNHSNRTVTYISFFK